MGMPVAAIAWMSLGLFAGAESPPGSTPRGPDAGTSTVAGAATTPPATPEELALARYLYVLENWELVNDLDLVELLPVIEEEEP